MLSRLVLLSSCRHIAPNLMRSRIDVVCQVGKAYNTESPQNVVNEFILKLGQCFSIKDLGSLNYFLGVQVVRNSHGIFFSQKKYIQDIVDKTQMVGAKAVNTPIATSNSLCLEDSTHLDDPKLYHTIVGTLQYLALTRPDIAFVVDKLAQFAHRLTENHWFVVKRVVCYLFGTSNYGIFLHSQSLLILHAFSDANWASNKDNRSFTSVFLVYLGKHLVSWSSKKQRSIARSSTKAEYRSIASATAEIQWIQNLLHEIFISLPRQLVVYCDNLRATYLAANPIFHSRMKHLEVDYHFVQSLVQKGQLRMSHISGKDQLADLFTKHLPSSTFANLRCKIGVSDRPPS